MGATIDEIIDSLKRGQGKRVSDLVKMALEEGTDPQMILEDGFLAGMEQVADKFRKEEVGVPEILSVTRALERGVSTLRHYSGGRAKKEIGTVIIGTVKGDLHDIGKNLVKIMMESKNIRVIDFLTERQAKAIGADCYTEDACNCAEKACRYLNKKDRRKKNH